ncbi:MAG UNVERIFIED_CONTAM: hypothetical protein LVT10_19955 [Anaerolineae bacterium]
MYIKRDYNKSFFGNKRRDGLGRLLVAYFLFLGAFLLLVYLQFDRLQLVALNAIGMAPTPTPFASELATNAYRLVQEGNLAEASVSMNRRIANALMILIICMIMGAS